tara:strand:+ start:9630 stop:9842 length:213 start_codon:yes stop_codon:yes gene_type:complete
MKEKNKVSIFKWEPFTYICEGFDGKKESIGGFAPSDVREKCNFCIKKIHGPVVTGFTSWVMYQIINAGKG